MKAFKYRITKVEEVSIEAEDEAEAADALHTYLSREGLDPDGVEVKLLDITDWGRQTVVEAVTRRNVTAVPRKR